MLTSFTTELLGLGLSWICFYILGKLFLESTLGSYHNSEVNHQYGREVGKFLFLTTFVIACTLIELVGLEIISSQDRSPLWTVNLIDFIFQTKINHSMSILTLIGFALLALNFG